VAFVLSRIESKSRRNRHEDYRALAEALRVQFFWMAAGLPKFAADQYRRKHAGDMFWIRGAMLECGLYQDALERSAASREHLAQRLALTQRWVQGQAAYFATKSAEKERRKRTLEIGAWIAAVTGLIAPAFGREPAALVAAVTTWCAGLTWTWVERRGYAQEARQYARAGEWFAWAARDLARFEREGNFRAAAETIEELGCEALAENGDWLAMHRERTLSVRPAG
jgi:hypothetical protein